MSSKLFAIYRLVLEYGLGARNDGAVILILNSLNEVCVREKL